MDTSLFLYVYNSTYIKKQILAYIQQLNQHFGLVSYKYSQISDAEWISKNGYGNLLVYKIKRGDLFYTFESFYYVCGILTDIDRFDQVYQRYSRILRTERSFYYMNSAAKTNNMNVVKRLHQLGFKTYFETLLTASKCGHGELFKYLIENDLLVYNETPTNSSFAYREFDPFYPPKPTLTTLTQGEGVGGWKSYFSNLFNKLTKKNDHRQGSTTKSINNFTTADGSGGFSSTKSSIDILKREDMSYYLNASMTNACQAGSVEIVKYLCEKFKQYFTTDQLDFASEMGNLNILEYAYNLGIETGFIGRRFRVTSKAATLASMNNHLHVIKFLHERCPPDTNDVEKQNVFTVDAMNEAASNGHLELVKFLDENRTEGCTIFACNFAAKHNHLHILKYLKEKRGMVCDRKGLDHAVNRGNLEVVKYLLEDNSNGIVVTLSLLEEAMEYNRGDVFKYLIDNYPNIDVTRNIHRIVSVMRPDCVRMLDWSIYSPEILDTLFTGCILSKNSQTIIHLLYTYPKLIKLTRHVVTSILSYILDLELIQLAVQTCDPMQVDGEVLELYMMALISIGNLESIRYAWEENCHNQEGKPVKEYGLKLIITNIKLRNLNTYDIKALQYIYENITNEIDSVTLRLMIREDRCDMIEYLCTRKKKIDSRSHGIHSVLYYIKSIPMFNLAKQHFQLKPIGSEYLLSWANQLIIDRRFEVVVELMKWDEMIKEHVLSNRSLQLQYYIKTQTNYQVTNRETLSYLKSKGFDLYD